MRNAEDADEWMNDLHREAHLALVHGPALDELNQRAFESMTASLDAVDTEVATSGVKRVDMFDWVRREMIMNLANAVYGRKHNPLAEPRTFDSWITFQPSIHPLTMKMMPRSKLRKALEARDTLGEAFRRYVICEQHKHHTATNEGGEAVDDGTSASSYIDLWTNFFLKRGYPADDMGRIYIGNLFAFTANTSITAFWVVYHIFRDPQLLQTCRDELLSSGIVSFSPPSSPTGEPTTVILNAQNIKTTAPTLLAVLNETFRVHGISNVAKVATEDHYLSSDSRGSRSIDGYLIKKDGVVMIPSRVQHLHPHMGWESSSSSNAASADDLTKFDHNRFLKGSPPSSVANTPAEEKGDPGFAAAAAQSVADDTPLGSGPGTGRRNSKHSPAAFRPFGGGHTLCPGRNFATTQILVFAAVMVLRFDVVPVDRGKKGWEQPTTINSPQAEGLETPDWDIPVEIRRRGGGAEGVNGGEGVKVEKGHRWRVVLEG